MNQRPVCSGSKIQRRNWSHSKKHYTHGGKERSHFLISKIDDYVKHIFREHNQEADHWANLGAEGQRTIISDKGNSTERWKTVRGFWDGSSKINGRVVMKAVAG